MYSQRREHTMLQHGNGAVVPAASTRRRFLGAAAAGAAVAATPLLTGCGGPAKADGGTLKFWYFYDAHSPDPSDRARAKWFQDVVKDWNADHEVKVELYYVPGDSYQGSKMVTAFASEAGPDIFLLSPGDFLRYQNGGILADLTPHIEKGVIEDYGSSLDSRMVDGKVYALPMEVEPLAMYYNVPVWEKAGLSEADIPVTWDEMLDVGDKLRAKAGAGLVFQTDPGYYQNFTWYPWMWQGGGDVVDENGKAGFDSRAARQALSLWQDAVQAGIAPRTMPAADDLLTSFTSGLAGMWQSGIWEISGFRTSAPKHKYGVFKLPVPSGGKYTTVLGGWSFCASTQGRNPEIAAEFCAWALGGMNDESVNRTVDWCTSSKSDIAPRASALERAAKKGGYDFWAMKKFKEEIFPGGRAEPRYPPVVYKAVSDAIQATMLAGKGVAGETDRAARSIEAFMQSYEGASLI
ncbi:ABC transporter substrate-binding protein [Streptomyces sp. NPDC056105]|uniref:ABC transporter substrate-binding protein n=1 Tax=Streptomyces sp. NPDC056105 TaxID=3345714 RepID=UPI0035DBCD45